MKREKGSLTVEAAIVLVIFIFGYAAITSITDFIRAQMIIQHSITQAAKDISSYCYLVSKTGLMEDSAEIHGEAGEFKESTDEVIDTVAKLYEAIADGSGNISASADEIENSQTLEEVFSNVQNTADITQQEFQNMVTQANNMIKEGENYFSDPKRILKGLGALAKDGAFSKVKSYVIMAPISKSMVKSQIDLYGTNGDGEDILERLGVVKGLEGLNFVGSTLFNDGKTVTVQVAYTMKVKYPGFDKKEFHFIQTASTQAWGSHDNDRFWRE